MLNVYWLCFAIGGAFVLLAMVSGFDGVDFAGQDLDIALDSDLELIPPSDRGQSSFPRQQHPWYGWLGILKSFKFWIFSLCFFGLTGLVLSHLSVPLAPPLVVGVALVMGLGLGTLVAGSLRLLQQQKSDSLVRSDDLIGLTGIVELPFDRTSRGKIRLQVKGSMIDSIAYTEDQRPFNLGDRVLVVSTEQNRLWVVSADSLNEAD